MKSVDSFAKMGNDEAINPGFKHNESLLRSALTSHLHQSLSDGNISPSPRISMSQLKLTELAIEQSRVDDHLQDFNVKELRDGYFDPIYTKPENIIKRDVPIKDKPKFILGIDLKKHILNYINSYSKNWIILTKFTIAYVIAFILCLIGKTQRWFGDYRVFLPIATLIHHPVHAVGTQVEMTVQSIIGLAIGLGWSSLALYISVATQPTRNHQGGILAGSLFIGLFVMGWFKGFMIRFYYMLLTSGITLIFLSTTLVLDDPTIHWKNCWNIAIPYLFGLLVSCFVSIVYFPYLGSSQIVDSLVNTTSSINDLLRTFTKIDTLASKEEIVELQNAAVNNTLKLSEHFREFLSSFKFSRFDQEDLKEIRNHINNVVSPLRVIPFQSNIRFEDVLAESTFSSGTNTQVPNSAFISTAVSGFATPVPKSHLPSNLHLHPRFNEGKEFVYVSIMNDTFSKPMIRLLLQMIETMEMIEKSLTTFSNSSSTHEIKDQVLQDLHKSKGQLKKKIYLLDVAYRKFSRSEYFCRALLEQEQVINIFLFLRYSRQSSVGVITLSDVVAKSCENVSKIPKLTLPNYPLKRSLKRLTEQCLRDQGADSIFRYMESKLDVDDAFERIYNLNTSRNKYHTNEFDDGNKEKETKTIRAIDHRDFNFHSTKNKYQFKLWQLTSVLLSFPSKYAFKVSFAVVFLSLPGWLSVSWNWYYTYNCNWAAILVYFFLSPRNSGNWFNLAMRMLCWLIGCFWGWAANEANKSSGSPVVIGVFAAIFSIFFSNFFLVYAHPRSSLISLLSFTIISLNVNGHANLTTENIWKHSWITSLAILVAVLTSVFSNWLIWPFIAKNEIYNSYSSLLSHIAQSYQSVSERYLYRDEDDDPTDLTLELANIREVRMSQNLIANEELLERAVKEYDFKHDFNYHTLKDLLKSCHLILEHLIEARMSSIYFHIWEQDEDEETTNQLLSLRRDSISTVIYLLYVLSNSIRTKSKIPKYLPSAISVRKKLFNLIANLELSKRKHEPKTKNLFEQLDEKLTQVQKNSGTTVNETGDEKDEKNERDEKTNMKTHWKEVHGMAFARAFTSITSQVEEIVKLSKELLGEEELFDELGM